MKNKKGFTLLEMSIVILIVSIVFITSIFFQFSLVENSHQNLSLEKLKKIENSIIEYFLENAYLPCPSNIELNKNDVNYGSEYRDQNTKNCLQTPKDGIIYGGIPTRDLDLSGDYAYDNWKSDIIYVVIEDYTKNKDSFLLGSENTITIKNLNNTTISNKAIFLIFSTGKNKNGSYRNSINTSNTVAKLDKSLIDYENINLDNIFIKDINTDDFDDFLYYQEKQTLIVKLGLENISCSLYDLPDSYENYYYNCENKLCSQNSEIQLKETCNGNYFSKNESLYKHQTRKCLKYGQWSDIMYPCSSGCGISNIYSVEFGNFYENNILYLDETQLKRTALEETSIFKCINGKNGYVKLKCNKKMNVNEITGELAESDEGYWEYISGKCVDTSNDISNIKYCNTANLSLSNATYTGNQDSIPQGSLISLTCNSGYFGSPTATCQSDGNWYINGGCITSCIEFSYVGSQQTYIVPNGVSKVKIEVWGAQGGDSNNGGKGGYSYGDLSVSPSSILYVYVGGQGTSLSIGSTGTAFGGWNGGGTGYSYISSSYTDKYATASGGGGATDVRYGGTELSNRVIVAGGGGGGTLSNWCGGWGSSRNKNVCGGSGGNLNGGNGCVCADEDTNGKGATTSSGGRGGSKNGATTNSGVFGIGASYNSNYISSTASNGGGGGYYGGGASIANGNSASAGGGGGSGYIGGVLNGGGSSGQRSGNGYAKICAIN